MLTGPNVFERQKMQYKWIIWTWYWMLGLSCKCRWQSLYISSHATWNSIAQFLCRCFDDTSACNPGTHWTIITTSIISIPHSAPPPELQFHLWFHQMVSCIVIRMLQLFSARTCEDLIWDLIMTQKNSIPKVGACEDLKRSFQNVTFQNPNLLTESLKSVFRIQAEPRIWL